MLHSVNLYMNALNDGQWVKQLQGPCCGSANVLLIGFHTRRPSKWVNYSLPWPAEMPLWTTKWCKPKPRLLIIVLPGRTHLLDMIPSQRWQVLPTEVRLLVGTKENITDNISVGMLTIVVFEVWGDFFFFIWSRRLLLGTFSWPSSICFGMV